MASAKSTNALKAPSNLTVFPRHTDVTLFEPGVSAYENLRLNGDVEIKMADGTTCKGTVRGMQVSPLIELITNHGPRHASVFGQIYSANSLVQTIASEAGVDVLDVTKLYPAVTVMVPMDPPSSPI